MGAVLYAVAYAGLRLTHSRCSLIAAPIVHKTAEILKAGYIGAMRIVKNSDVFHNERGRVVFALHNAHAGRHKTRRGQVAVIIKRRGLEQSF